MNRRHGRSFPSDCARTRMRRLERLTLEAVADVTGTPLAEVERAVAAGKLQVEIRDGEPVASKAAIRRWHDLEMRRVAGTGGLRQVIARGAALAGDPAAGPLGEAAAAARAALRARLAGAPPPRGASWPPGAGRDVGPHRAP